MLIKMTIMFSLNFVILSFVEIIVYIYCISSFMCPFYFFKKISFGN